MAFLCCLLFCACFYDYRHRKIPNWLNIWIAGHGFLYCLLTQGGTQTLYALARAVLLMALLYPVFCIGALGAGDIKLFGGCALFLPSSGILYFLFYALLAAAGLSVLKILATKSARSRLAHLLSYGRQLALTGRLQPYVTDLEEQQKASICLAGPIFISMLFYLGGVY